MQGYVLGGNNKIYDSQTNSTVFGDAQDLAATDFRGGGNLIVCAGEQGQNVTVYGDCLMNVNHAIGGNNTIYLNGASGTIYGDCADNVGTFVGGNNTIVAGSGNDTIYGGVGGNNTIYAGSGNSFINGGMLGGNRINGGSGNNTISGGGGGTDTFIFAPGNGHDTIMDFDQNGGTAFNQADGDKIDLSAYHLNATFGAGGIVVTTDAAGNAVITLPSTASDGTPSTITLVGVHATDLTLNDFILVATQVFSLTIQNDYLAITRTALPLDQATTIANAISAGTQTETQYVNGLLSQVANTTIPAVAVEASMYGAAGTSAEITALTTSYLPPQVANATSHGLNPLVYACETLGLVFAFGNENHSAAFSSTFGPSNSAMPNSTTGDAAFATAASNTIFGSASTANLVNVLEGFVANWKAFYTSHGIPGNATPTADQIDLAARGASWGDMVGVALANNLGPLNGQVINFLDDAAQGTAVYAASLVGQPVHQPFQGA